ncbi:DUF5693 family protein [Oceanobacillus halotolerans]|uniref:DUF5693 family protein n=1 Tax=Oceanobacillus halotolerans TaxID=2663380 RepID=UPI0013DD4996|nr:DUF5693 family protein [Oceanobacillus halotolerans]
MKKQYWIWGAIIVLLIISLPGLYDRWTTETENNTYEMVLPYHEIEEVAINGELTIDTALHTLKEAGLTTVSLNPITLNSLDDQDKLDVLTKSQLEDALLFTDQEHNVDLEEDGFYTTIPTESYYDDIIQSHFTVREKHIGDLPLYFFPEEEDPSLHAQLGYDEGTIDQVQQHGLEYVVRLKNEDSDRNKQLVQDLREAYDENGSKILFSGMEVIGHSDTGKVTTWAEELHGIGYQFYTIEFMNQKGLTTIANTTNYDVVRLHSINLNNDTFEENVDRITRAVKERNIRSIFLHLEKTEPKASIEGAAEFIRTVQIEMPNQFTIGTAKPFQPIDVPVWIQLVLLSAGILFTYLGTNYMTTSTKLSSAVLIFMGLVAIAYLFTQQLILLQGFALIIAVVTPVLAIVASTNHHINTVIQITKQYVKAIGISIVGIMIVVGLLNGNAFLTGFEQFRGVKVVYSLPIVLLALYLLWRQGLALANGKVLKRYMNMPIRYWHLAVIFIAGLIGYYYISRTGNAGMVSELEIIVRQKLEEYLYVRPRTKEFLIGFPLYMLGLYLIPIKNIWGKLLLILGSIGFLSIVNTFTHLHIPLYISILRTVYSLIIGYIIGLILIYLYNVIYQYISKRIKVRSS